VGVGVIIHNERTNDGLLVLRAHVKIRAHAKVH